MFKVLIVEDDQLYRHEIRNLINWENFGFTIIGEAINGKQALQKIELETPDIVFTDISMPGMNGVELIRTLRTEYSRIKVIVLSSYDDFNFVKDAMKFGAMDYILKYELSEKVLVEYLEKLRVKLVYEMQKNTDEEFLETNKYRISHEYLREILRGYPLEEDQMKKNLRMINRKVDHDSMAVADIVFYNKPDACRIDFMNRESVEYGVQNILLKVRENEYALIMFFGNTHSQLKIYNEICSEIQRFVQAITEHEVSRYSIGVSDNFESWKYLKKAYSQSVYAAGRKFFDGYGKVEFYNAVTTQEDRIMDSEEYYGKVAEFIKEGKVNTTWKFIETYWKDIEKRNYTEVEIREEITKHYNMLFRVCLEEKINFQSITGEKTVSKHLLDGIDTKDRLFQLIREYLEKIKDSMDDSMNVKNKSHKKEVYWIKKYIENNYMNDINLDILAEELNFTPSYICRIFKNNTGIRITEYLNQVRIEQAKRLIRQTNLKVHEISEMVGFTRVSYFCTTFKKVTGIKVSEYKDSL